MGIGSSKKNKSKSSTKTLEYYETSEELWVWGKKHEKALQTALERVELHPVIDVVLSYLLEQLTTTNTNDSWNHFNYTTYIHLNGTPLSNNHSTLSLGVNTEYRVIMLGGGGVGKSSLTIQLVTGEFAKEHDPTIEDSYRKQIVLNTKKDEYDKSNVSSNGQGVTLDVLDTAGREEFSAMLDQWFREGQIFLLVFSVVYKQTFDEIKIIRERILRSKDGDDGSYVVLAVGNKCDLRVDAKSTDKYGYGGRSGSGVEMKKVHNWCKEHNIPYIETSAKTGKNVMLLYRQSVYELHAKRKLFQTKTHQI